MKAPTPAQQRVRDHNSLALLLVAPAGCGKTEALAMRVAGLIENGRISAPRRALVTTFTNRAKDNIQDRLRDYVSYGARRDHVTVANFHGLSARIIRAHGAVIGIDPNIVLPDGDWVRDKCHELLGTNWPAIDLVEEILEVTKREPLDDEAVAAAIAAHGNSTAIQIEGERLTENRATYDDMLRYAELILANPTVARLYRSHFGAIVVDEYQDLTAQQFRVLSLLGDGNITYAGDLAQGIYSFTGADPVAIDAAIRATCDDVIKFNESHRSSPSVLGMVNAMNALTGGEDLVAADPDSWPSGGLAGTRRFVDAAGETDWVIKLARVILARAPGHRVGVMSRIKSRLRFIDDALQGQDVPVHRWDDGVLDTETAVIVRTTLARVNLGDLFAASNQLACLRDLADLSGIEDPDTRKSLAEALIWVLEELSTGSTPAEVAAKIQVGDQTTLLNAPGIHLLSGHVGKGQQFDWVIIVGAEQGNIPFFKAKAQAAITEEARILGVMLSRARHGVVVTAAKNVPKLNGDPWERSFSEFWPTIDAAGPLDQDGIIAWLKTADWTEIVDR